VEPLGKGCDRSVRTPELFGYTEPCGSVYNMRDGMQWEAERPLRCPAIHLKEKRRREPLLSVEAASIRGLIYRYRVPIIDAQKAN
jgi:hypothetical protein